MKHSQAWLDNLADNLAKASMFFNPKAWSAEHNTIWQKAMGGYSSKQITEAFQVYYTKGKHMPKPSEIITIIRELHPKKTDRERNDEQIAKDKPKENPIVTSAWLIFNNLQNKMNLTFPERDPGQPLKRVPMTNEQAIVICNHEAKRCECPDAIQTQFWIREIWGFDKPYRTAEQRYLALKAKRKHYGPAPDYSAILRENAA